MAVFRMIGKFCFYLKEYDGVKGFVDSRPKLKQQAVMSGEYADLYSSRWRFAWKMTAIEWRHRDRYGRKCRKLGGNCARCKAKHC